MKTYRVLVLGRNFHLSHIDRKREVVKSTGFYTTRFVTAEDAIAAEYEAMALIRTDEKLRSALRNPRTDPPIMFAEEIEEVSSIPDNPSLTYLFFTGEGSGRPRRGITLAAFANDAPEDIKEAAIQRYGQPSEYDAAKERGTPKRGPGGDA